MSLVRHTDDVPLADSIQIKGLIEDHGLDRETAELVARNGGIEGVTVLMVRMLLSDYKPKTEGELSDIDLIMNTLTFQELRKGTLENINRERGIDNKEDE